MFRRALMVGVPTAAMAIGLYACGGGNNSNPPTYSLMQIQSACITNNTNQTVNQGIYQSSSAAVVGISVWGNVTNAGNCNQSASNNNHGN